MTRTITAADNGSVIEGRAGDEIVVQLNENPTTGYRWQIDRVDGPLEPIGDTYDMALPGLIGGGGVHAFRFRATSSGSAHLALKHWRSWEGENSVTERFSLTVAVAD